MIEIEKVVWILGPPFLDNPGHWDMKMTDYSIGCMCENTSRQIEKLAGNTPWKVHDLDTPADLFQGLFIPKLLLGPGKADQVHWTQFSQVFEGIKSLDLGPSVRGIGKGFKDLKRFHLSDIIPRS